MDFPWTFSSLSEFRKEITTGKLSSESVEMVNIPDGFVQYRLVYSKEKGFPAVVTFKSSTGVPVREDWYCMSTKSLRLTWHREDGPAVISAKEFMSSSFREEYFYYGIRHGGPFLNGEKYFYSRIHGDTYSNWYYGLEVIPQERFNFSSKDSKIKLSKDLTLALCQPEEVEDMRIQFDQYLIKKLSKVKPNKAPIHSIKELITWLRDIRADLNFTSDVAAAEMIKDAAMKVYHQVTDDELKVLKRWGSQVMFWYRNNVNKTDKKFSKKRMIIWTVDNSVFPEEITDQIIDWLESEGLGYAV